MKILNRINSLLDSPEGYEDKTDEWRHITVIKYLAFLLGILIALLGFLFIQQ